jgi:hypothetical protein
MAGMFYDLQEIADKLGMTVEDAEGFAKEHKLREFRDGQRVVFKVTDVDALVAESSSVEADNLLVDEEITLEPEADEEEIVLEPEASEEVVSLEPEAVEDTVELSVDDDTLQLAPDDDTLGLGSDDDTLGLASESDTLSLASETNILGTDDDTLGLASSGADSVADLLSGESEFDLGPIDTNAPSVSEDSIDALLADDDILGDDSSDADQGGSAADLISDLTSADTRGATTGINVLAESDADYQLSSDSKADTQDADFEDEFGDLDDDINLDTVGSGSGLLDLSLQADDTSLGAVLDDILPAAEEGESMPSAEDFGMGDDADAIFEDAPANARTPVGASGGGAAVAAGRYVEMPADASSNACGIALLVPIVMIVFALIVVLSFDIYGSAPSFMSMVEGYMMYVVIGLSVVSLLIVAVGAMAGGGSGEPRAKKAKKGKTKKKKEKAPKKKKEKKKKKK